MHKIFIYEKNGNRRKAEYAECLECKISFLRRIYFDKNGNKKKFCSKDCSYLNKKKNTEKFNFKCEGCKIDCERNKSKKDNSKHGFYFCSRKCKEKAQSLDGSCQEIRPKHYGSGYSIYKNLIKRTNSPKCIGCSIDKKYLLTTHHIDGDRRNNNRDNLEIVCHNCHAKRHLKFENGGWFFDTSFLTPREVLDNL